MVISPQPLRPLARRLVWMGVLSLLPACGSEPPPPQVGSAEFDAAKKDYQEARRKEHGLKTFEPPQAKKGSARK